jgi:transcriptional regulator with XRE-family HTH domain
MLQRIVDAQRPRFEEACARIGARQGGWMMTAAELKARLKRLKLRQIQLAEKMQLHPVTVRRWATGIRPVPSRVDAWLDAYERELEQKEWLELYERQLGRRVPTPV